MLLVKTQLQVNGASHLIAKETIQKGKRVIKMESVLSRSYYHSQIEREGMIDFFSRYGFYDSKIGIWFLFGDNARFINHSSRNNIEKRGNYFYSITQINEGEEITIDYLDTCDWVREHGLGMKRNIEIKQNNDNDYPINGTITCKAKWAFEKLNCPSTVRDVYHFLSPYDNLFKKFDNVQYSALHIAISRIKNLKRKERKFTIFEIAN